MLKVQDKKLLNKQEGAVLLLVMITFMVAAILGTAVVVISSGEHNQAVAMDKDMRAYYQARSAADATMNWIEKQIVALAAMPVETEEQLALYDEAVDEFEKVVPSTEGVQYEGTLDSSDDVIDGVEGIEIWRESALHGTDTVNYIYVKATATVDGKSSSATVRLNQDLAEPETFNITETITVPPTDYTSGLFDDAIYAKADIDIRGGSNLNIHGNVHYEGEMTTSGGITFDPDSEVGQNPPGTKIFPDWNPPEYNETKTWPEDNILNASSSGRYTNVSGLSGVTTINTEGEDVILHIQNLDLKNNVVISATGPGRVFIFVDYLSYTGKNANLSILSSPLEGGGIKPNVYLILDQNVTFDTELEGGYRMEAYIYAPTHTITFNGTVDIFGSVICENFDSKGSVDVTYIPSDLTEEDFNNGNDEETTSTATRTITYTREGAVGTDGKQWLGE